MITFKAMRLHPDGRFLITSRWVASRWAGTHRVAMKDTYGWRWSCSEPGHDGTITGGSKYGSARAREGLDYHIARYHRTCVCGHARIHHDNGGTDACTVGPVLGGCECDLFVWEHHKSAGIVT